MIPCDDVAQGAWAFARLCGGRARALVTQHTYNARFADGENLLKISISRAVLRLEIGEAFADYSEGWGLGKVCSALRGSAQRPSAMVLCAHVSPAFFLEVKAESGRPRRSWCSCARS